MRLAPFFSHLCPALLVLMACLAANAPAADFKAAVEEARKTHYKFVPIAAHRLMMEDKLDEALQAYVRAVPDAKLTAADCFVLGEVFFRLDDEKALHYYRRAHEAAPAEPEPLLQLAVCLHRAGRSAEARPLYERCLAARPDNPLPNALLAECHLKEGHQQEAVQCWSKAAPEENSTAIAHSIFEVHGEAKPMRRRVRLLQAVRGGDTGKLDDLMALSATWDNDWWNIQVNKPLLERDVALTKQLMVKDAKRLVELHTYAQSYLVEVTPEWLKNELDGSLWLLGEEAGLPTDERVAERLMSLAVKHRLTDPATLLAKFEKELRVRAFGKGAENLDAAKSLSGLLIQAGPARAADAESIKLAGWYRYHDPLLAGGFLADRLNKNLLKSTSPELQQAVEEFPANGLIRMLEVILTRDEGLSMEEPLAATILAEYSDLSPDVGTVRGIARLKSLFKMLQDEL